LLAGSEKRRLPLDQVLRLADQICRALEHAHGRAIVHRDLKPANVWLTEDGVSKLGDFGLAIALDRSRITVEGMMVGTVAYMPPEQALGHVPDSRSDLYALGAMLYEMVTGRPPFLGDDAVALISQTIHTPPRAPSWGGSSACSRWPPRIVPRRRLRSASRLPRSPRPPRAPSRRRHPMRTRSTGWRAACSLAGSGRWTSCAPGSRRRSRATDGS